MPLEVLLRLLWRMRGRLLLLTLLLGGAGAAAVLLWPRAYVAEAVVAPAETTGLAASTLMQSGTVLQAGGSLLDNRPGGNFAVYLSALRSPEAAAMLIRETPILRSLGERRASGPMGWLRALLGLRLAADADDVGRWLERTLSVTQSLAAVTVSLELSHPDRAAALDMLARLHGFAEGKVRADIAELAARRSAVLEERLSRERDVYLRTPLYDLLAQHQRASLVALADTAVAARLVSAPSVEISPSLPNRPLLLLLLGVSAPLAVLLGAAGWLLLFGPPPARVARARGGRDAWRDAPVTALRDAPVAALRDAPGFRPDSIGRAARAPLPDAVAGE